MIDEINWMDFITSFFHAERFWIEHVTKNWNHFKNEPGCGCDNRDGPIYCWDYAQLLAAKTKVVIEEYDYHDEGLGGT